MEGVALNESFFRCVASCLNGRLTCFIVGIIARSASLNLVYPSKSKSNLGRMPPCLLLANGYSQAIRKARLKAREAGQF